MELLKKLGLVRDEGKITEDMKLIVGLGNPGKDYSTTRHNIGFRCINKLAKEYSISYKSGSKSRFGEGEIQGHKVALAKPHTFMNLSGKAVKLLMQRYKILLDDIVVIHDDLDLSVGKIRISQGGGSGGHKGIDSIISEMGSREFLRIRVGIGRPAGEDDDAVDYVLGGFGPDEKVVIEDAIARVSEVVLCLLSEGVTAAMNKFN